MYVDMHVCMYVCMYVCMHVCIYTVCTVCIYKEYYLFLALPKKNHTFVQAQGVLNTISSHTFACEFVNVHFLFGWNVQLIVLLFPF